MTDERLLKLQKALPDGICERFESAEALGEAVGELFSANCVAV